MINMYSERIADAIFIAQRKDLIRLRVIRNNKRRKERLSNANAGRTIKRNGAVIEKKKKTNFGLLARREKKVKKETEIKRAIRPMGRLVECTRADSRPEDGPPRRNKSSTDRMIVTVGRRDSVMYNWREVYEDILWQYFGKESLLHGGRAVQDRVERIKLNELSWQAQSG